MNEFCDAIENMKKSLTHVAQALKSVSNWWNEHQEGIKEVVSGLLELTNWYSAAEKLIDNQIVFTDVITGTLVEEINNSDDVDSLIESYYIDNDEEKLFELIKRCSESEQINPYKVLFEQICFSCKQKHYHLACVGLFAITDGLLSDVSENSTPNYKKRIEMLNDKIDNQETLSESDNRALCVYLAIKRIDKSIFANSGSFSSNEPDKLNRHWTLHGRTSREFKAIDFIKILLWIEALIIIDNYES